MVPSLTANNKLSIDTNLINEYNKTLIVDVGYHIRNTLLFIELLQ